jgi:hypothetical protein
MARIELTVFRKQGVGERNLFNWPRRFLIGAFVLCPVFFSGLFLMFLCLANGGARVTRLKGIGDMVRKQELKSVKNGDTF